MDSSRWKKISQILEVALSYPDKKRSTYILDICGNDRDLLNEVNDLIESLNEANREESSLGEHLENNVALIKSVFEDDFESKTDVYQKGKSIGRWNLLEMIGSGGMGSVYKVIRITEDGVHQTGALKIIHKSLTTSSHIDRFKLEQQILSGLEHPNIARLIDSGITPDGIPYMVIEYVEGDPILDYCDNHRLTIDQRLELFKNICRTVQYAHKSLVVHRDLKSDNILVTPQGHIKILDFGIAKLLDPNLYEFSSIETQPGMRLLSLEYASPEQVRGEAVTTSTDLYSLGILLYKLLVEMHPFDVDDHSYREVETMVLEREPPLPGIRYLDIINTEKKASIAANRGVEPIALIKRVKGDLDAIIFKILRKDPERRYISVETLVTDLERHQKALPIFARPDSYGYRFQKFLNRHRWGVIAVSLVLIVLTAGIVATLWQANQADLNAQKAELQAQRAGQITEFLVGLFEAGDPAVAQGAEISIANLLEKGIEKAREPGLDPHLQMNMLATLGRVYLSLGEYETSIELLQQALVLAERDPTAEQSLLAADIQTHLGLNFRFIRNLSLADSLLQKAFENRKNILGEHHPLTISSMDNLAAIQVYKSHDLELADSLFQDILNRRRRVLDSLDGDLAESINNLGYIKTRKGEFGEALKLYEEASGIYRVVLGEHHPTRIHVMSSIAYLHHKLGDLERSENLRRETIEIMRKVLGEDHPNLARSYYYLAELLLESGRPKEALENSRTAVAIMQSTGTTQPAYPDALILLARNYQRLRDISSTTETYRLASASCVEQRGVNAPICFRLNREIGEFLIEHHQHTEAATYLEQSYEAMRQTYESDHPELLSVEKLLTKY